MKLFVGLGNPGKSYENNRHNIGFLSIDKIVNRNKALNVSKSSFFGELYKKDQLLFLKPTTYMNLSGKSVQAVANFYKISLEDIIVIHDDLDIPFGAVRFKKGGGHGGHNGLKSIDSMVGGDYTRVRLGIGKPEYKSQVADYVLSDFDTVQAKELEPWLEFVSNATQEIVAQPLDKIQSTYTLKSIQELIT